MVKAQEAREAEGFAIGEVNGKNQATLLERDEWAKIVKFEVWTQAD